MVWKLLKRGWRVVTEAHTTYWIMEALVPPSFVTGTVAWFGEHSAAILAAIFVIAFAATVVAALTALGYRAERRAAAMAATVAVGGRFQPIEFPASPEDSRGRNLWRPIHLAIKHIAERIEDGDAGKCWPTARRQLRQAAYDKRVRIRGRKQLQERTALGYGGDYSDIHTDVDSQYWATSEINALATSPESQTHYHVDPQTAFAWGQRGVDERNRHAELQVNWSDVVREWPPV
jgi:hypothetical protein